MTALASGEGESMSINRYAGSRKQDWNTPQEFFDMLDAEFHFTLDPCCEHETAKCARHFTPDEDGLAQDWSADVVFLNPPYGGALPSWMAKAYAESQKGATVVCLVPAYVDTEWWHEIAARGEIRLLRNRIHFEREGRRKRSCFASAVIVFRPDGVRAGEISLVEYSAEERGHRRSA